MLNEFLKKQGPEAKHILYIDTKLTENDRKIQGKLLLIISLMNISVPLDV